MFVSSSVKANEVWLIDADNLHFQSAPGPQVYTPGFGAPEIVAGHAPVSTLSDTYAFAILAFYILAQIHPFLGNQVEEGGWEESVDLEEQAYAGELPWIEDEDDDSNWSEQGDTEGTHTHIALERTLSADLRPGTSGGRKPTQYARMGRNTTSVCRRDHYLWGLRLDFLRCAEKVSMVSQ